MRRSKCLSEFGCPALKARSGAGRTRRDGAWGKLGAVCGTCRLRYSPAMADNAELALSRLLGQWEVFPTVEQKRCLLDFIRLLLEWNVRINVTGAKSAEDVVGEHFPDSLALLRLVPNEASVVDIGSGGGLPAIPFSVLRPDCRMTLVEPRAKRVAFLNTAVRLCLSTQVRVLRQRLEDCELHHFDLACSRATFSPTYWLEAASALLVHGGMTVVFSTCQPVTSPPGLCLVRFLEYGTANGSARWAGCYRST